MIRPTPRLPKELHPAWLAALLVPACALLWLLMPVLMPFATAAILAYILHPAQSWLTRHRVNGNLAALLVIIGLVLLLLALLLIIAPLVIQQVQQLYHLAPHFADWVDNTLAPALAQRFGIHVALDHDSFVTWIAGHEEAIKAALPSIFKSLGNGGRAFIGLMANVFLTPVVLFYFLRDGDKFSPRVLELVPRRWDRRFRGFLVEIDDVLSEFLRGQLTVMLVMCVIYSGGLYLAGLNAALPVGIVSGLLTFIPYLGSGTGMVLATLAAAGQFGSVVGIGLCLVVFLVGMALEGNLITPYLVGDRIGLHPVAVIFALMAFGQLFGFVGVLLALPMAAILQVGLRHLRRHYLDSDVYRKHPHAGISRRNLQQGKGDE
ncbi:MULTISPECIES: AI-2E family transporter [Silvimonas]|uniref:AI-2E family transporter n=1 Tax=Silvimonas TaxID=300264 RepID=UPI0024B332DC|nr:MULTISPECIES: AI-2E family transporter [Silvimonas]MDR3425960.1 AI-2E family transporter [Silvimonas sp.]